MMVLCRYYYDALDRLVGSEPLRQPIIQRFFHKNHLVTEIQGQIQRSIFQKEDQLLAQQRRQGAVIETTVLATDQQRSVLHTLEGSERHPVTYTAYGYHSSDSGLCSLLGFNGEPRDLSLIHI